MAVALKAGDICYVKTSGEITYILALRPTTDEEKATIDPSFSGQVAVLRVPVLTKDAGIRHEQRAFLVEELEVASERVEREYAEAKMVADFQESKKLELVGKAPVNTKERIN